MRRLIKKQVCYNLLVWKWKFDCITVIKTSTDNVIGTKLSVTYYIAMYFKRMIIKLYYSTMTNIHKFVNAIYLPVDLLDGDIDANSVVDITKLNFN